MRFLGLPGAKRTLPLRCKVFIRLTHRRRCRELSRSHYSLFGLGLNADSVYGAGEANEVT